MSDYYSYNTLSPTISDTGTNTQGFQPDRTTAGSHLVSVIPDGNSSRTLASENVVRWFEQDKENDSNNAAKPSTKPRRRIPPGADHVKHRRTRSGCYTCRARRVKCDETRPTCERCRKGARECTWPPDTAAKTSPSSKSGEQADQDTGSSGIEEEDEEITSAEKPARPCSGHANGPGSLSTSKPSKKKRTQPDPKRIVDTQEDKSMSPSTTEETKPDFEHVSPGGRQSTVSTNTSFDDIQWSKLKQDHQFYLTYHERSLSYCYYFLKQDFCHFIETTLIDAALTYEPLLYAVVGFSAFHYALVHPGHKISTFLGYYNKAVSLLRHDLFSGKTYTDATIYTILQLATFEEYLGDWANLMSHQKAACELIKRLYTPESLMQTSTSRMLFSWYIRFDIFVGFMTGSEALIGFEWFQAYYESTRRISLMEPENLRYRLESLHAENRLLGMNMAMLFARFSKREIEYADFVEKNQILLQEIRTWGEQVHALRSNTDRLVWEFDNRRPLTPDDIVDPFIPGAIFDETLFAINYMMMDCMGMEITHKMQTATVLQQMPPVELTQLSLQQCQIFEAIQEYQRAPKGAVLPAQVNIGLICFFVPRDMRHINWCRKMLLRFENSGYIYPPSFRAKVAEGWSMPGVKETWLMEGSQQPQIIKELKLFIEERTMKPQTQLSEDVRSMKAILEKLNLEESPKSSPEIISSATESTISPVHTSTMQAWQQDLSNSWPRQ